MNNNEKSSFLKNLNRLWRGINIFRIIVLNVVFFILLYLVLGLIFHREIPEVPSYCALVINPHGTLVEEISQRSPLDAGRKMLGSGGEETLLKDMIDAINAGKTDPRIKVLVLDLNGMGGSDLPLLTDLTDAIDSFKKSGKKVIASADNYSRNSYYVASHADEVFLEKMGRVVIEGFSSFHYYYKEGLDKFGVDVNIFRVGKYKSAVEPFSRNDMSPEAKEANMRFLQAMWDSYVKDVSSARKIKPEAILDYTNRYNVYIKEAGGNSSKAALNMGLIDHAATRDEVSQRLIQLAGENSKTHSYSKVNFGDYLEAIQNDRYGDLESGDVVGVITAEGSILDGNQLPGSIGGDSTAALIREARYDKHVKAIVLRVNSPGGSAFGSEVIRRECELARKDGKPVIISMSGLAASGGYWISMASDEIWAYPTTITGSIGIFGMVPTFQKPLANYLGIHMDGISTNKMGDMFHPERAITPEFAETFQATIEFGYDQFLDIVSKRRNKTKEQINEIAQGRVWIGADAYKLGLVDRLGNFKDALNSAAKRGKLGTDYRVKYFYQKQSFRDRIISQLFGQISSGEKEKMNIKETLNPFNRVTDTLVDQLKILTRFNDPNGVYAFTDIKIN